MPPNIAVIIGAGPAGLTAAYELLKRTNIVPIVLEKDDCVGGLARTVNHNGNRIDIGGHRFYSKSDRVLSWWFQRLPLQAVDKDCTNRITYQQATRTIPVTANSPDPNSVDRVMLLRRRKSRIYYLRKLFDYPVRLSLDTLAKLGLIRTLKIMVSYVYSLVFPRLPERSLEDLFINRFGKELYSTFFKAYTEKVWGMSCDQIDPAWGEQRINKFSVGKAIYHAITKLFSSRSILNSKAIETTLIEQFLYPKYGPGQLWDLVAEEILQAGGQIFKNHIVCSVNIKGTRIVSLEARNELTGCTTIIEGSYFFSSMPVKELVRAFNTKIPISVMEVSDGLPYRDLIVVGLLVTTLKLEDKPNIAVRDNWIYIQEPDVKIGRLQIFNNWSPYLVQDQSKFWLGLEYFCTEEDQLWKLSDRDLVEFAMRELIKIEIIEENSVIDSTTIRMPKAYPGYFGTYSRFDEIRAYLDQYENLFLIGRNGMHRYNNQDHAMLTAMSAVDNIIAGTAAKNNIWDVNIEASYLEEKPTKSL